MHQLRPERSKKKLPLSIIDWSKFACRKEDGRRKKKSHTS